MSTNARKKGKRGNIKVNHREDRLSNLPNEILVKILSCVETKEAVRSGILSRRWKSVWHSVPVLDLNQSDFNFKGERSDGDHKREEAKFLIFVDQVLIARKLPCLEKIRIFGGKCDPYLLRSWMRAALERNAHELEVKFCMFDDSPCELTHDLFSYNKLVILKLSVDMKVNFLANSFGFPNLKFLELDSLIYKNEDSLPNLLASCPILEDLDIFSRYTKGTLNIISRSVKRLKLHGDTRRLDKVVLDAPAVESLDFCFFCIDEIVVKDSSIVEANFERLDFHSPSDIYKLLRGISNVRFLWLDSVIIECIQRSDAYNFPIFCNLTRLEVSGDDHYNYEGCPDDERAIILQWELVHEILTVSPMLQHLIYEYEPQDEDESSQEYAKMSDWDVPDCLVSSLKTVEFKSYAECDVEKVRFFMVNAKVLEKMTITHCWFTHDGMKSDLCNAIFENKKGSLAVTWSEEETVVSFL